MLSEDCLNVFLCMKPQHGIWKTGLQGAWADVPVAAIPIPEMSWAR